MSKFVADTSSLADWISIVTGPTGLAVSVLGFGLAIWQIRKVRKSTEAAASASSTAARTAAANMVLFLIPDLQAIASEISTALESGDRERLPELLDRWRETGIRVRGLLKARGEVDAAVLTALTRSFAQATDAKAKIRSGVELHEATTAFQRSIDKAIEEVGDLGGQMLVKVEERTAVES